MAQRTRYGIGTLGVLAVIVLAYFRLTLLKLDSPQVLEQAEGVNALSKSSESFAGSRQRHLNAQQSTSLRIQLEQFASQNFWIVAETGIDAPESEYMKFGQQLRIALLSAAGSSRSIFFNGWGRPVSGERRWRRTVTAGIVEL